MPGTLTEANLNDPITRHMRSDFGRLQVRQTVGEALADIRERPPAGRIIYFYVVDAEDRLQGVVPTRRLLLSPLDRPIAEVMIRPAIALPSSATVLDACEFFTLHRFLAFPVVDEERRMIGTVDVELYTDELSDLGAKPGQDDLFQLIGVRLAQARQTSPLVAFRLRAPWLLCNLTGGILAAFLAGAFEETLQKGAALAYFIPVVLALAESVSTQSASLALQALQGQRPTWNSLGWQLGREAMTGLLLGGATGLVLGFVALAWLGHVRIALCLLIAVAAGVACSAMFGLAMPAVLRLLRRDPEVAAGPIALAASDLVTLLLYLNLGRWLIG